MGKNKQDDTDEALKLLELGRDYLIDVLAAALLRAEQLRRCSATLDEAEAKLDTNIVLMEREIVDRLEKRFRETR